MSMPEQRFEQNIRRTVGMRALKEVRDIVDEDLRWEAVRKNGCTPSCAMAGLFYCCQPGCWRTIWE
ncbi:MAG: hypothetical protein PHT15_06570 [Gallionellaceae bacterium]|nr:hypothetical protein [Gallionellaceae bacterium]